MRRMARCPACDDALTTTEHEGVMLRLCNDCGGIWATQIDLEDLRGGPVAVEQLAGKTKHRCATCSIQLSKARLDAALPVELCTTCRGVFFLEGQVSMFAPPRGKQLRSTRLVGTFLCGKCGLRFPLAQGAMSGGALACRKCAGLDGEDAHRAGEDAAQGFADWFARHRTLVLALLALVMTVAIVGAQLAWENVLGGLLDGSQDAVSPSSPARRER